MFDKIFGWVLGKAKDYLLRNWKTTLVGILGGVLTQYVKDPEARQAILAAVIAGVGIFAKDGDKSGTTVQPRESVQPGPVSAPVPTAQVIAYPDRQAEPYDPSKL
jgi:hypothetical protein